MERKKAELDALRPLPLPSAALRRLDEQMAIEWTYHSNAVEHGLTLYLEACTPRNAPLPPEEAWIPLREAAQGTLYSQEYLGLLARKGRLEAIKRGRIWFTTR